MPNLGDTSFEKKRQTQIGAHISQTKLDYWHDESRNKDKIRI